MVPTVNIANSVRGVQSIKSEMIAVARIGEEQQAIERQVDTGYLAVRSKVYVFLNNPF